MFDRLIESEPETADFKNRRSYFMVSSVVVGVLFLAAVVISIYAENFDLGNGSLEMAELIAPVDMAAAEPEPPKPQKPAAPSQARSEIPQRQVLMSRTDEFKIVPDSTSVVPNNVLSRPDGPVRLGPVDTVPLGSGRDITSSGPSNDVAFTEPTRVVESIPEPEPPPVKKETAPKKPISGGVVNGKATSLPKPLYSAAAKAVGAQGKVDVQVLIDESGRVVSANAVSGHVLLRANAEDAARRARFSPTYLTGVAVKVTGVIVYNFVK